jgi:hypothetical protein
MEARLKGRANRRRGEVDLVIGGERRILCLTLGALAELETAFAADNLAALAERFSGGRLKASDLIRILGAGLRGGGNLFSDEDVALSDIEGGVSGAVAAVADLLALTFGGADPALTTEGAGDPRPFPPQPEPGP